MLIQFISFRQKVCFPGNQQSRTIYLTNDPTGPQLYPKQHPKGFQGGALILINLVFYLFILVMVEHIRTLIQPMSHGEFLLFPKTRRTQTDT